MILKKDKKRSLYFRLCVYFSMLIIFVSSLSIGVIYFRSSYYFNHVFEDRVIQYHNNLEEEPDIKDEWILGVTANSIDLVEAIHGKETANQIFERAKEQNEKSKLYREYVDGKYIMYMIDVDEENGERVYRYSVLKDIYKDIIPNVIIFFIITMSIIFIISLRIIKLLSGRITSEINEIGLYADMIADKNWDIPIEINSDDPDINSLVSSFESMREKLSGRDKLQQSILQYISHELKTPIMIIASYSEAAKDGIFPAGNSNSTFDIIISQTERIKKKVSDLLILSKLEYSEDNSNMKYLSVNKVLIDVIKEFEAFFAANPNIKVIYTSSDNVYTYVYEEELKVAFENIIENRTRYSKNIISIRILEDDSNINVIFYNDGDTLELDDELLFRPFEKGKKGKSGLGMSICYKVLKLHKGNISHIPSKKGCIFKLSIPKKNSL